MKKRTVNYLLVAISLLVLGVTGCGAANTSTSASTEGNTEQVVENSTNDATEKRVVLAATGGQTAPFTYIDENGELTGHNIDLLNAIFERLPQYELQYEITEIPSIFAGLDSDRYDIGVNNFVSNEDRKEKYLFSDPFLASEELVIANNSIDLSNVNSLSDLKDYGFVGGAGINHTIFVEKYNESHPGEEIEISYTDSTVDIQLSEVESGKYDFTLADKAMYYGYYEPIFGLDVQVKTFNPSEEALIYFLFRKEDEQLVADVNAAYRELVEEGIAAEISEKYYGSDLSPAK